MGVKAGVEPLPLWEAIRQGAGGRARLFDRMSRSIPHRHLRSAGFRAAAAAQGRVARLPVGARGRRADAADQPRAPGTDRGAGPRLGATATRRVSMLLQQERAGIDKIAVPPDKLKAVLECGQVGATYGTRRTDSPGDFGGDPAVVRDYAQAVEAMGYDFLEAPDHVLGVNAASRPDWDLSRNTSQDLFHDPFVLFGFLAGCTSKLGFSTGVLILAQRQTVLVAKQAACLDVLCGGRFRLGIGVGWNEVEFVGLNENFRNRGRRSEEQVQVMQALWAQDHVAFKGKYHTIDDAGINPRPASGRVPVWFGGHHEADAAAHRQVGRRLDAECLCAGPGARSTCSRSCAR